mgnify:CR=1 FL=1
MTKEKAKDLAGRAAWTFAQAFLAVLLVTPEPFSKVALVAAVAAGVSALKTFVKETL